MSARGLEAEITRQLEQTNHAGHYWSSVVCTDDGLVIASAGSSGSDDSTAAFASLFDDVLRRAVADLGMADVDEVTIRNGAAGRTVIRPLRVGSGRLMFLVLQIPSEASWRRNTNVLCKSLTESLQQLVPPEVA